MSLEFRNIFWGWKQYSWNNKLLFFIELSGDADLHENENHVESRIDSENDVPTVTSLRSFEEC